jgi:transcriptional regulator with PAS, ATPase and Fis domain
VGSGQTRRVDVRVMAASSRNLQEAVEDGSLREDLYYRLATVELVLRPLRARRGHPPAHALSAAQARRP